MSNLVFQVYVKPDQNMLLRQCEVLSKQHVLIRFDIKLFIQVCTFHDGVSKESISKFLIGN